MAAWTDCLFSKASWRTRGSRLRCVAVAVLTLLSTMAPARASEAAWAALSEPRTHAIMRHALAPGRGDPPRFRVDDCGTQRNLDARGRAQAKAIGDRIRGEGVTIDRVLSSQWCRCLDTGEELALGPVEAFAPLNSFFADRSRRRPQTEALRTFLGTVPDDETLMLVTHQVNLSALTGVFPTSGEIVVFRYGEDGRIDVIGRIRPPAPGAD